MMIENAFLYEDQLKKRMLEVWYDLDYQYYFSNIYRADFSLDHSKDNCRRDFVFVDNYGLDDIPDYKVFGFMSYYVNPDAYYVNGIGLICFDKTKSFKFANHVMQIIDDIFNKYRLNKIEFRVICGNPAEKKYDRLINKLGGSIIGISHECVKTIDGVIHDDKEYEILRRNYKRLK